MPFWHQKNDLCYNSRLSRIEFNSIVYDFCRGISASQSSSEFLKPENVEFKGQASKKISRQTISRYFIKLSESVLDARLTYPWWSVDHWGDITDGQLEKIRKSIYNEDNILKKIRKDFVEETGKSKSVDIDTYMKILRDMSVQMNGLSKNKFIYHLGRACEIAYYIDEGFSDPAYAMFLDMKYLFEYEGIMLFRRKASPTTREAAAERVRKRKENEDERIYSWHDVKENERDAAEKQWWNGLSEDERKKAIKKAGLTVFDGDIELPHKGTMRRIK